MVLRVTNELTTAAAVMLARTGVVDEVIDNETDCDSAVDRANILLSVISVKRSLAARAPLSLQLGRKIAKRSGSEIRVTQVSALRTELNRVAISCAICAGSSVDKSRSGEQIMSERFREVR